MKFASFRPQVEVLESRLQPGSILGSPLLSDGLGIMDHALQIGFEEVARQNTLPRATAKSGSQLSTPAQPVDNLTPIIPTIFTQLTQTLQAPPAQGSQAEALQNFLPRNLAGKAPSALDLKGHHKDYTTAPGNLVCDGDFESGIAFQGTGGDTNSCWWGQDDSSYTRIVNSPSDAHSGNWYALLGPVGATDAKLAQIVPTTADAHYVLSFWLANEGGTPNYMRVHWDGVPVFDITDGPAQPYTQVSINVTASHPEAGLEFYSRQEPAYWHLDDISLTPVA
jgi:hypothetical protein